MEQVLASAPPELPDWARNAINLADPRIGAVAVAASDEFFGTRDRMLQPAPAIFIPGKYDEHGKWVDGWETRRKRVAGEDWCVVRLGRPGTIAGMDVDTSFFTGNYPPACILEACRSAKENPGEDAPWFPLAGSRLTGNTHNFVPVSSMETWTHVRLRIQPDGGIARLRVYGRPVPPSDTPAGALIDLGAMENGGHAVAWNDAHFGAAANLTLPGRASNMGEGWETRRRREPGHDWCILELGVPGDIRRVEVDTAFFKGNFPDQVSIQAAYALDVSKTALVAQSMFWATLLPPQLMSAHAIHDFEKEICALGPVTHVRFNIFPDGGVSRLRLWGIPAPVQP